MNKLFQSYRQGFSLLEVLISVFVVLIGLLGVATMIPAARYEMLEARKADMGADLSRAIVNSVISQLGKSWDQGNKALCILSSNTTQLTKQLITSFKEDEVGLTEPKKRVLYNDRTLNGDDDIVLIDDDNGQISLVLEKGSAIGTGAYVGFATIVPLENGYYEVTGGVAYRPLNSENKNYQRGSYVFIKDDSGQKRWYKIENVYTLKTDNKSRVTTTAGVKIDPGYVGDVVGICRKVVRLDDSYSN